MIVKRSISKIFIVIIVALVNLLLVCPISAASPSLSFYPSSGIIKSMDDGFTVDVLVDSAGQEISGITIAFNFDPDKIQIRKASRNNSLFEQWPKDESALDNKNGVVMLTGFTQSGSGPYYKTTGEPDLLARIEFDVITENKDEEILLTWEFGGGDPLFETKILNDNSPPQNLFDSTEIEINMENGVFRFGELTQTAINPRHLTFIIGGILILLAGVLISSKPEFTRKKYGTVVVYD